MSIRKIWAAEATRQLLGSGSQCVPKKPSHDPQNATGSPSKIPISVQMQQKVQHRRSLHKSWGSSSNKENRASPFALHKHTTEGKAHSSDGSLASEIVLSAARHARNRRSSCNLREQEVWKAAVNNVGLPRTSTEVGRLPVATAAGTHIHPLCPVNDVTGITATKEKVKAWVLRSGCPDGAVPKSHLCGLASARMQGRSSQTLPERATVQKSVDCAPLVPPRTYLAKLAHAKAHLAHTTVLEPSSIVLRTAPLAEARTANCRYPTTAVFNKPCGKNHQSKCGRAYGRIDRKAPLSQVSPKKQGPARHQHNPNYGFDCSALPQKNACSNVESDAMADDEISVLNCSCRRCLLKFSNVVKQPHRKVPANKNAEILQRLRSTNRLFTEELKRSSEKGTHCQCCNCKALTTTTKKAHDVAPKIKRVIDVSRHSQPASSDSKSKTDFHRREEISRVVEEAVKASIEKLLSMNSVPHLIRSRSVESIHEVTPAKKVATSPLKYILLTSCTSGAASSLKDITEGNAESGIVMSQQSCSTDDISTGNEDGRGGHLSLAGDGIASQAKTELERATSLPSLVESCSPLTTRVSTAFIKLVKRVKASEAQEGNDPQQGLVALDADNLSVVGAQSLSNSSTTEDCWHTADSSHCETERALELSRDGCPEQTEDISSSLAVVGDMHHNIEEEGLDGVLAEPVLMKSMVEHAGTEYGDVGIHLLENSLGSDSGKCTSHVSLCRLPRRRSPDGWERTPPTDVSVVPEPDGGDLSELNSHVLQYGEGSSFSDVSESSEDDDQHILEEVIRKGMGMTPPIELPLKCPKPIKTSRKFRPSEFFSGKGTYHIAV